MPFRPVLGKNRDPVPGHQAGTQQKFPQGENGTREALAGPHHQFATALKTQQVIKTVTVQMIEEQMVQRGDAVVRLHAASMGRDGLRLSSETNTKAAVESSECSR